MLPAMVYEEKMRNAGFEKIEIRRWARQ